MFQGYGIGFGVRSLPKTNKYSGALMELFGKNIINNIGRSLLRREETIAVAESVTSGMMQLAIGSAENASAFFQGGITAYNMGQKYKHLHVDPIHAETVNSVSQRVAEEMAAEVCNLFSSDWGVGVTGYATPVEESGFQTFAFFAIIYRGKVRSKGKLKVTGNDPGEIQSGFVEKILRKLTLLMK